MPSAIGIGVSSVFGAGRGGIGHPVAGIPAWAAGFDLATDYASNQDYYATKGLFPPGTDTHAATIYEPNAAGVYLPFAVNVPTRTNLGLQTVPTRTNSALWCRDLTNAAWIKTTATAAKDQTGIDGAANSASSLTATAGNATALQTIVLGSSADTFSVFLKRLSGTGTINITMDGGLTWTPAALTAEWARFQIQQTFLNPVFGVQIVSNGEAVAVDFSQLEVGAFASAPILTTAAAVIVNGNQQVIDLAGKLAGGVAGIIQFNILGGANGATQTPLSINAGASANRVDLFVTSGGNLRFTVVTATVTVADVLVKTTVGTGIKTVAFAATTDFVDARMVGQADPGADVLAAYPAIDRAAVGGFGYSAGANEYQICQKMALKFGAQNQASFDAAYAKAQLAAAA